MVFIIKNLKLFIMVMALVIMAAGVAYALDMNNADYSVDVYVYGEQVVFPDQKPFIDTSVNRTYVPVRFVSEALGATVDWDQSTQTVTIIKDGQQILLTIDSDKAIVGTDPSEIITLDAPAALVNDRTVVPLRFVSEVLGATVDWTPSTPGSNNRVDITLPSVVDDVYGS